jgi:sRNA-binding carbon storage regulator CsrA
MGRLSLTRFVDQKIIIHNKEGEITCVIRLNKIKDNGSVVLTFEADEDVKISREEIYNLNFNY